MAEIKIAIPTVNGILCSHFGHCDKFTVVTIDDDDNSILSQEELTPPPHEPGVLPKWLHEQGAKMIIAGGMGMRAQQLFQQNDISVIVGAPSDSAENLVKSHFEGTLQSGDNLCDH